MYRNTKNVPYYVFGRGSLAQLGDLLKPRREAVDGPVVYFVDHFFRDHELIGRLPVVTVLDPLDEEALVRVLTEPKNSIVRQYKELLAMDSAELSFTDAALRAIVQKTIARKSGARGLRSVVEDILIPIMYEIPSDPTITRVTIDADTVNGGQPHLEYGAVRKRYKNQVALS